MAESPQITQQGTFGDTRRNWFADGAWTGGCDTLLFPTDIQPTCYSWSVNTTNRGGIIQTRPRRRRLFSTPGTRAQGFTEFLTLAQTQYLVWAVDGNIYYSAYPFTSYSQIQGLSFSSTATQIYFCPAIQAAKYNPDNSIAVLPTPVKYLFIQDGISAPGWWDGTTAFQPPTTTKGYTGVPTGTIMAYSNGRLWVAVNSQVFASDYVIPTQFRENQYLAETSGFQFLRAVTALLIAPQDSGLFVFTDRSLHGLQSNIVNRTLWQTTPNFQSTITEYVGCVASFSPIYQHGVPWFWSAKGFLSIDMALQEHISNTLYTRDGEMRRSKARLSPLQSGVCTGIFENVLMVSVPHASQFNRHTWIQDGGIAPKLNSTIGPCWTGIWTGTYPVQFATIIYQGIEHNYELSYANGYIQSQGVKYPISIWENFLPIATDDGLTPVRSQFETKMFRMPNDDLMQACFVEVLITQLSGIATLNFFVGGIAGLYNLLSTSTFRADTGPFFNPAMMTIYYGFPGQANTIITSYRPQNRYPRSAEVAIVPSPNSSHFIEVGYNELIDKGFQVLLTWTGNMAIRGIKFYYRPYSQGSVGQQSVNESATSKIVLEAQ